METEMTSDFLDEPPQGPAITDYDRTHFKLLMRLVDAEDDGADWEEAVQILFGIDPDKEPERAHRIHQSHLARAHWLIENGYDELRRQSLN
jgi:hypothetical protein